MTTALIAFCVGCGVCTAIDFEDTPVHHKELEFPGRKVISVPTDDALQRWESCGGKCRCELYRSIAAESRVDQLQAGMADGWSRYQGEALRQAEH